MRKADPIFEGWVSAITAAYDRRAAAPPGSRCPECGLETRWKKPPNWRRALWALPRRVIPRIAHPRSVCGGGACPPPQLSAESCRPRPRHSSFYALQVAAAAISSVSARMSVPQKRNSPMRRAASTGRGKSARILTATRRRLATQKVLLEEGNRSPLSIPVGFSLRPTHNRTRPSLVFSHPRRHRVRDKRVLPSRRSERFPVEYGGKTDPTSLGFDRLKEKKCRPIRELSVDNGARPRFIIRRNFGRAEGGHYDPSASRSSPWSAPLFASGWAAKPMFFVSPGLLGPETAERLVNDLKPGRMSRPLFSKNVPPFHP